MFKKIMLYIVVGLVCCVGITRAMQDAKILEVQKKITLVIGNCSIISNGTKYEILHTVRQSSEFLSMTRLQLLSMRAEDKLKTFDCKIREECLTDFIKQSRKYLENMQRREQVDSKDTKVMVLFDIFNEQGGRGVSSSFVTKKVLDELEENMHNPLIGKEVQEKWLRIPVCRIDNIHYHTIQVYEHDTYGNILNQLAQKFQPFYNHSIAQSVKNLPNKKVSCSEEEVKKIIDNLIVAIKYNKTLNSLRAISNMKCNTF